MPALTKRKNSHEKTAGILNFIKKEP